MHVALLSALNYDPQLRGALIVLVGVAVLPGSVYLLLATNNGAKVGLLLALAGLSGWLVILNILWLIGPLGTGPIGYKGVAASWQLKEIVEGNLAQNSAVRQVAGTPGKLSTQFPNGWTVVEPGTNLYASAAPAADTYLVPPAAGAATPPFPAPFVTTQDYLDTSIWTKGGDNWLVNLWGYKIYWRIRGHQIYLFHEPHYTVVRVQKIVPSITLAGAAATLPANDPTQPVYNVVLERNVGSLRLPPILIGFGALSIFLLTCENLHAREKAIQKRKAEEEAGPKPRSRELQPA